MASFRRPACTPTPRASTRSASWCAPSRTSRVHAPELYRHKALLSADLLERGKIADARALSLDDFRQAWRDAERMRAAASDWAGRFDAILTLPAPGQAPRGLQDTGSAIFNGLWTVLYMPCLTLPAGTGPRSEEHT